MNEKQVTLCSDCRWREIVVEIRGGTTLEYPSCDFAHQWFKRVTRPEQCRDYTPLEDGEKS